MKSGKEIFKQCRAFTEGMVYKRVSFDPSRRHYSRFNSLCVYGHVYALTQTALKEEEALNSLHSFILPAFIESLHILASYILEYVNFLMIRDKCKVKV